MQKKGARYLRFSQEDQSVNSIERQGIATYAWSERNNVTITATFTDDGYSARTLDRPDVQKLFEFIKKNARDLDYLIVQDLSRFSREAGEAITMVKKVQLTYNVRIVSCDWNQIYDVTEANSYFMMLIEFGRATAENLTKINNTNGGIYAAKTGLTGGRPTGEERGRYIGSRKPPGYTKIIENKSCNIGVVESERGLIEKIYSDYLSDVPIKSIKEYCRKAGLNMDGKVAVQKIIANPVYKGYQQVKAWKNNPGGLFRGSWEPIIDPITWQRANDKLKGNKSKGVSLSDTYYLKNVLHCYCGRKVTAAPSKGKLKYYPYYKCNCSRHLNVNADYAHQKLNEIFKYLSFPDYMVEAIKDDYLRKRELERKENKKLLSKYKLSISSTREKLLKVEEKFIADQINPDTYNRWYHQYRTDLTDLEHRIEEIEQDDAESDLLAVDNLALLSDIPEMLKQGDIIFKQNFLNEVFDSSLYMREKTYRTPYLTEIFRHNELILKQKQLLFIDKKRDSAKNPPQGSIRGPLSNTLTDLLTLVQSIKVA